MVVILLKVRQFKLYNSNELLYNFKIKIQLLISIKFKIPEK